ncbi:MAG: right-handed parallel beta-helix repeat-containing protein, partial [Nannocystaceae bacterium]|nr:right-handed parallel beta-helix repeat-containing protein [Nannocystaceae bacterium]
TVFVFEGTYAGFRVSDSGTREDRIVIWAQSGVDLEGAEPGDTNNIVRFEAVSYITVRGFRIVRDGTPMAYDYDNACVAARGTTVDNPMRGLTIRDNEIAGCSPAGLYASQTEGLRLENNHIHDNVRETQDGNGQAIYLSNAGTDNVIVRNNRILDNQGPGIHMNGDSSIGGDGLQSGHLFEGNLIIGNGQNGFNMDGVQDCVIVNNVFAANERHAIRGFRIDAEQGPGGMVIVNNTFVQNGDTATRFTDDVGGNILFNNLVVDNGDNIFDIEESTPLLAGNVFLASTAGAFEDAAGRDFRITEGSGAVDVGVAELGGETAPEDDLNGFTRTDAPDVGAFELGSD